MTRAPAALVILLFAPACLHEEDKSSDWSIPDGTFLSPQGNTLQGNSLQGNSLQGNSLQGDALYGVALQGMTNEDGPITNITLEGTSFSGTDGNSDPISGTGFIGAILQATGRSSEPVTLRIDDIQTTSDPDILHYTVSYLTGGNWTVLCRDHDSNPGWGIPLEGRWDYSAGTQTGGDYIPDSSAFTFGCMMGVLAKCVGFGYKPWEDVSECYDVGVCHDISRRHFHQACTRMMRADFCGNGTPHTVSGTQINLYDNFGLQDDESEMPLEAEWTPEGAQCVKHLRWTIGEESVLTEAQDDIDENCTEIDSSSAQAACGSSSSTFFTATGYSTSISQRVLLRSESEPPPPPP